MFEKSRFCWCYVPPPYIISIYLERKKFCQCKSATKWGSGFLCESLSFLQETFNFETENSLKSIVQPSSPRLVVGPMHLQISFIVLFVPLPVQNQCKIPPKEPFSSSDRIGIGPLYPIFCNRPIFMGLQTSEKKPLLRVRQKGLLFSIPTFCNWANSISELKNGVKDQTNSSFTVCSNFKNGVQQQQEMKRPFANGIFLAIIWSWVLDSNFTQEFIPSDTHTQNFHPLRFEHYVFTREKELGNTSDSDKMVLFSQPDREEGGQDPTWPEWIDLWYFSVVSANVMITVWELEKSESGSLVLEKWNEHILMWFHIVCHRYYLWEGAEIFH